MSELQFVRVDGETLLLADAEGVTHSLVIDDVLRAELRRSSAPKSVNTGVSPRAIQEAIREGATIAQLVEQHDADEAYVAKFAQPVLDELAHAVTSARQVRISLEGDRFSDVTQIDFGDLIARRLDSSDATEIAWHSKRLDQHTWLITVKFELPGGPGHASWSFDPRRLTLTPENDSALTLSSAEALNAGPIPRLRPVTSDGQAKHPSAAAQSQNATEVIDVPARSTIKEAIAKASPVDEVAKPAAAAQEPAQTVAPAASDAVDLLDQLRKKRMERDASTPDELPHKVTGAARPLIPMAEPEPVTSSIRIINDEPLVEAEASQLPASEPEDTVDEAPSTEQVEIIAEEKANDVKRGRAGIPSWDEIVFGTKTDD